MKQFKIKPFLSFIALMCVMLLGFTSCKTPQNVYMSGLKPGEITKEQEASMIRAIPGDQIGIYITSKDPALSEGFNLLITQRSLGNQKNEVSSSIYTIDENGCVTLPILGNIRIEGLTREEICQSIEKMIRDKKLLADPIVTVELRASFIILGDVRSPGQYSIGCDKLNIWEAIARAGDANLTGLISEVLLVRQENGKDVAYRLDLTNAEETMNSPAYWIQQNDMIYIEPNKTKRRQTTVNGNVFLTTSFWMSAASLLTTILVLIVK